MLTKTMATFLPLCLLTLFSLVNTWSLFFFPFFYLIPTCTLCTLPTAVPVTEAWRDELRALTEAVQHTKEQKAKAAEEEERRPKTQYSAETGRLIPPPSRAMSRGGSRGGNRGMGQFQHIMEEPDTESMVSGTTVIVNHLLRSIGLMFTLK